MDVGIRCACASCLCQLFARMSRVDDFPTQKMGTVTPGSQVVLSTE